MKFPTTSAKLSTYCPTQWRSRLQSLSFSTLVYIVWFREAVKKLSVWVRLTKTFQCIMIVSFICLFITLTNTFTVIKPKTFVQLSKNFLHIFLSGLLSKGFPFILPLFPIIIYFKRNYCLRQVWSTKKKWLHQFGKVKY